MSKKIVFIPGLNGRFNYDFFEKVEAISKKDNFIIKKINFEKYNSEEKYTYTFNEQVKEILSEINELNKEDVIIARSLGCIPALLIPTKAKKILLAPVIRFENQTENILDTKFLEMETKPIVMNKNLLSKNTTIIFGDSDNKIDINNLESLKKIRKIKISSGDHSLSTEKIDKKIIDLLLKC